ncbi:dolichyl-diphosphooligosaccharide--protein glycosyltransferase subunit [Epilithonimonas tenax]|nr:dolichyl-diphosphooligosaccharide--protein glycosyltransferase subunit [Epilithonimonas tenax]
MMDRRLKNEMRDWLRMIGWILFVIAFLYIIIKIKTIN